MLLNWRGNSNKWRRWGKKFELLNPPEEFRQKCLKLNGALGIEHRYSAPHLRDLATGILPL